MMRFSGSLAVGLVFLIFSINAFSIDGPFCSQTNSTENISETSLKTGIFYTVTTQNDTNSYMTWSFKSHPVLGHRYIVADQSKKNRYKYEKGGIRYFHAHWYFLPAKGNPGWYHLANRGIPGEFAAWDYKNGDKISGNKFYLILDPTYANSVENNPKSEYLFKPVKKGSSYQLKLKALPDAFVAGSSGEELKGSDRFYLLANGNEDEAIEYQQHFLFDGKYFESSLFNFSPV